MQTINATRAEAEDALVLLAGHLPADVPIGRPRIATGGAEDGGVELLTELAGEEPVLWFVWPDRVQRLMPVGGRNELVEWAYRVERSRVLGLSSRL